MADKGISVSRIKPDKKVQIGCKQKPDKVRNLQICCQPVNSEKLDNHKHHKDYKKYNPDKCKKISFHIKENYWPKEVHEKLEPVNERNPAVCFIHKSGTYPHKGIKNRPYDWEHNWWRSKWRLDNLAVHIKASTGNKTCKTTH